MYKIVFKRKKSGRTKWANIKNRVLTINIIFNPFMFNTFDFLELEIVDIVQRVQRIIHKNVVSPSYMNVAFKRIGFVI